MSETIQEGVPPKPRPNPNAPTPQEVLSVAHYTDRLFKFRIARPPAFRFRSGEFVMIGLPKENGKPLLRAYSVASPAWDEALEFYSIKVPDGPLTSRLQKIQPGDAVWLGKKPTGTLVTDALTPGKRLWMFSTGTGFAPFSSLIRDPDTYERFDQVIVTHTCRLEEELAYGTETVAAAKSDPLVGEQARAQLVHFTSCTRAPDYPVQGRITDLMDRGTLFSALDLPPLDPAVDRAMICGSMEMIQDTKRRLEERGFAEGSNAAPADFVIEKAFSG
ncbi:MAG: ferredoxin--NADP reductase [Pseudomonadota bacterium]